MFRVCWIKEYQVYLDIFFDKNKIRCIINFVGEVEMKKYTEIGYTRSYIKINYIGSKIKSIEKELKIIKPIKASEKILVKV